MSYFSRIAFLPVEASWAQLIGDEKRRLSSALRRQISDCIGGAGSQAMIRLPEGYVMERRGAVIWLFPEQDVLVNELVGIGETVVEPLNRKLVLVLDEHATPQEQSTMTLDGRLMSKQLTLRNWQAGDRIKIHGRPTKKISDLLSQDKLTPVERSRAFVLADSDGPLVLLGKYIDKRALPDSDCRSFLKVSWIPIHGE